MSMMMGSAESARQLAEKTEEGPADGHTFRIGVDVRGSFTITGEGRHRDAGEFDSLPQYVEVRAWNLSDALRKASEIPLGEWFGNE